MIKFLPRFILAFLSEPSTFRLKNGWIRLEPIISIFSVTLFTIFLILWIYQNFGIDIQIKKKKWKMWRIRKKLAKQKLEDLKTCVKNVPKNKAKTKA